MLALGGGLDLTPSAQGAIITVNEARKQMGLPPIEGGDVTITEYLIEIQGAAQPPGSGGAPEQGEKSE